MVKRLLPAVWALLTVGVVVGVVWAGLGRLRQSPVTTAADAEPPPPTRPATLRVGHDYYLLVKLVEFNPLKPNGSYWDRGTNTTPDPKAVISWRGQDIYTLPTREDTFIATWDLFRVNLKDVALSGGNVDIASSINAPIVRVEAGGTVRIRVYDADVMVDDLAADVTLPLTELVEGDNDVPPPPHSGIRRLIVQAVDRQTPLADLVALAGKR